MKKILSLLVLATLIVAFPSCDSGGRKYKVSVVTGEATNISMDSFTLHGEAQYQGDESAVAECGFFYGKEPQVSHSHYMFTTKPQYMQNGVLALVEVVNNVLQTEFTPAYKFESGETCYYRAYVRVFTASGEDLYYYGDEKSFILQ